jgi:hypothetical protein
LPTH